MKILMYLRCCNNYIFKMYYLNIIFLIYRHSYNIVTYNCNDYTFEIYYSIKFHIAFIATH